MTSQLDWPISDQGHNYRLLTMQYLLDSDDDFRSGCPNVSQCHQKQFLFLKSDYNHTKTNQNYVADKWNQYLSFSLSNFKSNSKQVPVVFFCFSLNQSRVDFTSYFSLFRKNVEFGTIFCRNVKSLFIQIQFILMLK